MESLHKQGGFLDRELSRKLTECSIDEKRVEICQNTQANTSATNVRKTPSNKSKSGASSNSNNGDFSNGPLGGWNCLYDITSRHWKPQIKYVTSTHTKLKETRNTTKDFLFNEYKTKLKGYNYVFKHYADSRSYIQHYRRHHSSSSSVRALSARTITEMGVDSKSSNHRDAVKSTPIARAELPNYASDTLSFTLKENTNKSNSSKIKFNRTQSTLDPCLVYKYKLAPNYINTLLGQLPNKKSNPCIVMDPSGVRHHSGPGGDTNHTVNNFSYSPKLPSHQSAATFSLTKRSSVPVIQMNNCDELTENSIAPQSCYNMIKPLTPDGPLSVNGIHSDMTPSSTIFPRYTKATELLTASIDSKNTEKYHNEVNGFHPIRVNANTNDFNVLWDTSSSEKLPDVYKNGQESGSKDMYKNDQETYKNYENKDDQDHEECSVEYPYIVEDITQLNIAAMENFERYWATVKSGEDSISDCSECDVKNETRRKMRELQAKIDWYNLSMSYNTGGVNGNGVYRKVPGLVDNSATIHYNIVKDSMMRRVCRDSEGCSKGGVKIRSNQSSGKSGYSGKSGKSGTNVSKLGLDNFSAQIKGTKLLSHDGDGSMVINASNSLSNDISVKAVDYHQKERKLKANAVVIKSADWAKDVDKNEKTKCVANNVKSDVVKTDNARSDITKTSLRFNNESVLKCVTVVDKNNGDISTTKRSDKIHGPNHALSESYEKRHLDRFYRSVSVYRKNYQKHNIVKNGLQDNAESSSPENGDGIHPKSEVWDDIRENCSFKNGVGQSDFANENKTTYKNGQVDSSCRNGNVDKTHVAVKLTNGTT